jgi:hypothetical protein
VHAFEGTMAQRFTADDAQRIMPILDWHPSRRPPRLPLQRLTFGVPSRFATPGHAVELTDNSPFVFSVDHARVFAHNRAARALYDSPTLDAAEDAVRAVCGRCAGGVRTVGT